MNEICAGHGWRRGWWCRMVIFEKYKADYDREWKRKNQKYDNPIARLDGHAYGRVVKNMRASNIFRAPIMKGC
jgi:hypothetical protein